MTTLERKRKQLAELQASNEAKRKLIAKKTEALALLKRDMIKDGLFN